jgi:pilus assembly protein CpaF
MTDGSRRVTSITEVQRMEVDVITLQELFAYRIDQITDERVVIGTLASTGLRPTFLHKFEKRGIPLGGSLFQDYPAAVAAGQEI